MNTFKIGVFADKDVGEKTLEYLLENHIEQIGFICVVDTCLKFISLAVERGFPKDLIFLNSDLIKESKIEKIRKLEVDYILLAWWPFIIKEPILSLPKVGIINFHPSYLPYNRGKHYNFWTIIEDTVFGVTIHFVNEAIDGGDIIFQKKIVKTWEDTGKTLYEKAQRAMIDLFIESYPKIVKSEYIRKEQNLHEGSFHIVEELEPASQIFLDKEYKARDLINLLRAKTFPPHPACYFFSSGEKYEVRIDIRRIGADSKN